MRAALKVPESYRPLEDESLAVWLATLPVVVEQLGGGEAEWRVTEVGDGNPNLDFLVDGSAGGVCVKQAPPYVRLVGEA